uniref:Uncharacterized protein n=1 Tax=Alexandrium catenella TaxID=2925 RepID=A0A7S1QKB0_ALECA|mmetsp:Transcript_33913/g.91818  ORF Transcript_33913/g.91818 Transcript_33913/m.91818 type:complete len:189 (+) Transcript_33913:62-628(+)
MRNPEVLCASPAMGAISCCSARRRHRLAGASLLLLCSGLAVERALAFAGAHRAIRSRSQAYAHAGLLHGAGGRAALVGRPAEAEVAAQVAVQVVQEKLIGDAPWEGKEALFAVVLLLCIVLIVVVWINVSKLLFTDEFDYGEAELEAQKRGGKIGGGVEGPKKIPEKMTPARYKALKAAAQAGKQLPP